MASTRELTAVYYSAGVGWVATIRQGCIIERHVVIKRSLMPPDDAKDKAEAEQRAKELV